MDKERTALYPTNKMSETLKSRLKRSSIYALSPVPTKRQCMSNSVAASHENQENQLCAAQGKTSQSVASGNFQINIPEPEICKNLEKKEIKFESNTSPRIAHSSNASDRCDLTSPYNIITEKVPQTPKSGVASNLTPKCTSVSRTQRLSKTLTFSSPALKSKKQPDGESRDQESMDLSGDHSLDLHHQKSKLKTELAEKEETLRKLKMVKMYRTKNNLDELQELIDKWRGACQEALTHLVSSTTTDSRSTLGQLINHLQIDPELVRYNEEEDDFV